MRMALRIQARQQQRACAPYALSSHSDLQAVSGVGDALCAGSLNIGELCAARLAVQTEHSYGVGCVCWNCFSRADVLMAGLPNWPVPAFTQAVGGLIAVRLPSNDRQCGVHLVANGAAFVAC